MRATRLLQNSLRFYKYVGKPECPFALPLSTEFKFPMFILPCFLSHEIYIEKPTKNIFDENVE